MYLAQTTQPTIERITAEALQETLNYAKDAAEFTKGQLPLLAEEIVNAGLIANASCVVVCLIILIICIFSAKYLLKAIHKADAIDEPPMALGIFLSVIIGLGSFTMILITLYHTLFIWFAPRLYIIQEVNGLIK